MTNEDSVFWDAYNAAFPLHPFKQPLRRKGMIFKAKNGEVYELTKDAYFSERRGKLIYQASEGWFYPENIQMWCYSLGVGSSVLLPSGEVSKVTVILPNGTEERGWTTCCADGNSYCEYDLTLLSDPWFEFGNKEDQQ